MKIQKLLPYYSKCSVFFGVLIVFLTFFASDANAGTLYLSPSSDTVSVGETFSVTVRANLGSDIVNAVQANLSYPADKLEFVGIDPFGSAFNVTAPSSGGYGSVTISRGIAGTGVTGDKQVATVSFKAKTNSTALVSIDAGSSLVRGPDQVNVFSGGANATISILTSALMPTGTTNDKITISNIRVNDIDTNSATISWQTDKEATSIVEYGSNPTYGVTAESNKLTKNHSVILSSNILTPGITYHFRVKSVGKNNAEGVSQNYTFTTLGYTINITVTDENGSPMNNIEVGLSRPNGPLTAITDAGGVATFKNVAPGQQTAFVNQDGNMQLLRITVQDSGDIDDPQIFTMKIAGMQAALQDNSLLYIVAIGIIIGALVVFMAVKFFYQHTSAHVVTPLGLRTQSSPATTQLTGQPVTKSTNPYPSSGNTSN